MPPGVVYVGRGTIWGNPFVEGSPCGIFDGKDGRPLGLRDQVEVLIPALTLEQTIEFYRDLVHGYIRPEMYPFGHDWSAAFHKKIDAHASEWARMSLCGEHLACWCPLDQPCHADVLLEIANQGPK